MLIRSGTWCVGIADGVWGKTVSQPRDFFRSSLALTEGSPENPWCLKEPPMKGQDVSKFVQFQKWHLQRLWSACHSWAFVLLYLPALLQISLTPAQSEQGQQFQCPTDQNKDDTDGRRESPSQSRGRTGRRAGRWRQHGSYTRRWLCHTWAGGSRPGYTHMLQERNSRLHPVFPFLWD